MKKFSSFFVVAMIITTFFTSCESEESEVDPDREAYDKAEISEGGIMYDKFWSKESGYDQTDPNIATLNEYKDFFRCKQCHGWDGLGSEGAYINRSPKTTRPNVHSLNLYELAQTKTPKELFDAMKETNGRRDIDTDLSTYDPANPATRGEGDKMPNYSELLTDAQIWNIVKFMKEGMFDVTELYDADYTGAYPNGSFDFSNIGTNGDEANGNKLYTDRNCALCHGADGSAIIMDGKTVGEFTRSKAYEVQHKVKYGQLGSSMGGEFDMTSSEMKDLYKALANETNFPDNSNF